MRHGYPLAGHTSSGDWRTMLYRRLSKSHGMPWRSLLPSMMLNKKRAIAIDKRQPKRLRVGFR